MYELRTKQLFDLILFITITINKVLLMINQLPTMNLLKI